MIGGLPNYKRKVLGNFVGLGRVGKNSRRTSTVGAMLVILLYQLFGKGEPASARDQDPGEKN